MSLSLSQMSTLALSGVQRFLDAQGQRGSWMPGANEVLGCPGPTRFLDARGRSNKIYDDHSLVIYRDLFFLQNWVVGCPPLRLDARGRHTVRTPLSARHWLDEAGHNAV